MKFFINKKEGVKDIKPFKTENVLTVNGNPTMERRAWYKVGTETVVKSHNVGPSRKEKKTDKRGKSLRFFKKLRGSWNRLWLEVTLLAVLKL